LALLSKRDNPGRLDGRWHDRANAAHLARGDGHALAGGASENAQRPRIAAHGIGHGVCELGIVAGGVRIRAQVLDLSTLGTQAFHQILA
jgi:hypothetical protein